MRLSLVLLSVLVGAVCARPTGSGRGQRPLNGINGERAHWRAVCPPYENYAQFPHAPRSEGPMKLPFQRPAKECRTFESSAVEDVIADITGRMKDADLARLFENAFPNTLDTTISWHDPVGRSEEEVETPQRRIPYYTPPSLTKRWKGVGPQTFIVTGDIRAEWLRDSTNQLQAYHKLATKDAALKTLIQGAISTQAEYVIEAPYCNAFQPPPVSNVSRSEFDMGDEVYPRFDPDAVFECKWELDSLAHFLRLGNEYYAATRDTNFVTTRWVEAVEAVLRVAEEQSVPTFNLTTGEHEWNAYSFQRNTRSSTETHGLGGQGNPFRGGTGLVRSAFRPSDDATIFPLFIPANAMFAVELERTAALPGLAAQLSADLKVRAAAIRQGIAEHGIVTTKPWGDVFAFEVDGYGSQVLIDDANVPSLLALPMLGFVSAKDPVYKNTRNMILSQRGNPYFLTGTALSGIGGPHVGLDNAWPMSLLIQALTSDNDTEIVHCLDAVKRVSPLGLVHESVRVGNAHSHTRPWFAWANSVFAQTILDLAERKPHLVIGKRETSSTTTSASDDYEDGRTLGYGY